MSQQSAVIYLYLAVSILSVTGILSKLIPADAISITQMRCTIALVGFLFFAMIFGRSLRLSKRADFAGVFVLAVLMGLHWMTFFHAMQVSTIVIGMLSFYSYPLITVIVEPFFSKKSWQLADIIAALIVTLGVAVLVVDFDGSAKANNAIAGVLWGVASAFFMALRNLIQKYRYAHISSGNLMFYQVAIIALVSLPLLKVETVSHFVLNDWLLVLALGLGVTAGGHTLLVACLKQLPAKTVALIGCMQPVIAAFIGWLVIAEVPSPQVYVGGAIILGVALFEGWKIKN